MFKCDWNSFNSDWNTVGIVVVTSCNGEFRSCMVGLCCGSVWFSLRTETCIVNYLLWVQHCQIIICWRTLDEVCKFVELLVGVLLFGCLTWDHWIGLMNKNIFDKLNNSSCMWMNCNIIIGDIKSGCYCNIACSRVCDQFSNWNWIR